MLVTTVIVEMCYRYHTRKFHTQLVMKTNNKIKLIKMYNKSSLMTLVPVRMFETAVSIAVPSV